jgi:alkaline phosphatase D
VIATTQNITATVAAANPWIGYLDGIGHGYALIDVTPDRVQADFHHTPRPTSALPDPRIVPSTGLTHAISWQTLAGSRRLSPATGPVGPRADEPTDQPGTAVPADRYKSPPLSTYHFS